MEKATEKQLHPKVKYVQLHPWISPHCQALVLSNMIWQVSAQMEGRCNKGGSMTGMQGPISISDKMLYHKISQSLEAARLVFRIVRSLWNLTGASAAALPMFLSNFKVMWLNYQSRSFETSRRDPTRRLIGYWNGVREEIWVNLPKDTMHTYTCI